MSTLGISLKNNKEQQELVRLIEENNRPIIFAIGKAGTGKTFATLATALQMKMEHKYGKIVYARNPVQLGEDMGALPGDIDEKYNPFMAPLFDNLEAICRISKDKHNAKDLAAKIEVTPIAFLRGRSFEDTILIIDEAKQRRKEKCDFEMVIDKLRDLPYVGYVELHQSMRSPICVEVDDLLGEIK